MRRRCAIWRKTMAKEDSEDLKVDNIKDLRKKHNADILQRMKEGDTLQSYDSHDSWYPPRPIIKKDEKVLAKLYDTECSKPKLKINRSTPKVSPLVIKKNT